MSGPAELREAPASVDVLLRARAEDHGERRAFTMLGDGESGETHMSYAELDRRAREIASELALRQLAGERAVLLFPSGLDFIAAFFGCLYAGVVAVPAALPDPVRVQRTLPRLVGIIDEADARVILSTAAILQVVQLTRASPRLAAMPWLAVDRIDPAAAARWSPARHAGSTIALLQYTSGSSGAPRGVIVTHDNLLVNERMISQAFGTSEADVALGWLPLYHDMGLMGLVLQPIFAGFGCVLMSPLQFLQHPHRWLQAITHHRATISGGPNFAYQLCVRKLDDADREALDLRHWRIAFCGAEPVRADTVRAFTERFADRGFRPQAFYPCYGLAEATLFVAGKSGDAAPPVIHAAGGMAGHALVSCGRAWLDSTIAIVDPATGTRCPPGAIGEIWVSGGHIAHGYWRNQHDGAEVFRARLPDSDATFLRTGDLGFVSGSELFITGRLKDVIIVRGRNYYPQDVEAVVEACHPRIRPGCCAAFPVELDGEERLAIAVEVRAWDRATDPPEPVFAAIRRAVAEELGVAVGPIGLLAAGAVPKTSSGKLQRRACRAAFLDGTLDMIAIERDPPVAAPARPPARLVESRADIEACLRDQVAAALRQDAARIEPHIPLVSLGLDSLGMVELQDRIEAALGLRLADHLAWKDKSLAATAELVWRAWQQQCGNTNDEHETFTL